MAKTIKALIKGNIIATAYIELDNEGNVKVKQILDIKNYITEYVRKL